MHLKREDAFMLPLSHKIIHESSLALLFLPVPECFLNTNIGSALFVSLPDIKPSIEVLNLDDLLYQ